MVDAGALTVVLENPFLLEESGGALQGKRAGHVRGKVALTGGLAVLPLSRSEM